MRRSNCSAPIPHPEHHRGHNFFGDCPGPLITLLFSCPALYEHSNQSFFQCPALFYHTHFSFDPWAAWQNNLGAEQFDRHVICAIVKNCKYAIFNISLIFMLENDYAFKQMISFDWAFLFPDPPLSRSRYHHRSVGLFLDISATAQYIFVIWA